jgi:hypothetical protein
MGMAIYVCKHNSRNACSYFLCQSAVPFAASWRHSGLVAQHTSSMSLFPSIGSNLWVSLSFVSLASVTATQSAANYDVTFVQHGHTITDEAM